MQSFFFEEFQHFERRHTFVDEQWGFEVRFQLKPVVGGYLEEVFQQNDTYNFINVIVGTNRIGRVFFFRYFPANGFHVVVFIKIYQIAGVCHEGSDFAVAQFKNALHNVLLDVLNLATLGAFLDDGLDFFFRHLAVHTASDTQ